MFCYELGPHQNVVPSIVIDNVVANIDDFPKKSIKTVTPAQVDLDKLLE
jgi:hypothetical protein